MSKKKCYASILHTNELLYERMFSNALPRFDIENRFFPVKSAASYSLLYLLLRVVTETPVKSVVELGAGQTTLLLDALKSRFEFDLMTLEHSREWIGKIQQQVGHEILHVPLIEKELLGHSSEIYDFSTVEFSGGTDLLLIDGPVGRRKRSRWGCLELIDTLLTDDFIIIFDDAERKGELETIEHALQLLESLGRKFSVGITESKHCQCLIAGGRFSEAVYY